MENITVVEYNSWKKVLLYWKLETNKSLIKRKVERIIGDGEMEIIKEMNLKEVKELIERVLNYKPTFDEE